MDITEFVIPARWQKLLILHGFDPMNATSSEFLEFCKRLEYAEDPPDDKDRQQKQNHDPKKENKHPPGTRPPPRRHQRKWCRDEHAYCQLHQMYGHDTEQCYKVLDQVKTMKEAWDTRKRFKPNNYKKNHR